MIVHLTSYSTEKCRSIYEKLNVTVHDGHMCTLTTVGEGVCHVRHLFVEKNGNKYIYSNSSLFRVQADSGGPLVYNNELVGIVGFGNPP